MEEITENSNPPKPQVPKFLIHMSPFYDFIETKFESKIQFPRNSKGISRLRSMTVERLFHQK